MIFHDPYFFFLIPVLLAITFLSRRTNKSEGVLFPSETYLRSRKSIKIKALERLYYLRVLSCVLLIAAISRPQVIKEESKVIREGMDIVLAVDVSSSMLAEEVENGNKRSRIETAKEVIRDFILKRPDDRIGMVIFASHAYTFAPLTFDHKWLLQNMARIDAGMIEDGTALGAGVMSALSRFKEGREGRRMIILLTDGRNNSDEMPPALSALAAKALNVKVYTIGIGSSGPAYLPVRGPFGNTVLKSVDADFDDAALRDISAKTGARYFNASDASALVETYNEINRLEKGRIEEKVYNEYREIFLLFLIPGVILLMLEFTLRNTFLRTAP